MPVFQVFSPLMIQSLPSALRGGLHPRRVGAVLGFGDPEGEVAGPGGQVLDPLVLLLVRAVGEHQQQPDVVADDGVLVLQVAVQAEAPRGQVLADHRHVQVGAAPAPELGRERVPVVARGVRPPPGLPQELLPLPAGQPTPVPIRSGILPPVVEEPDVVVLLLQRLDLPLDELVQLDEVGGKISRQLQVHPTILLQPGMLRRRRPGRASGGPPRRPATGWWGVQDLAAARFLGAAGVSP